MTQRVENSQLQGGEPSPESQVSPYEGIHTQQKHIPGETLPNIILGICDKCLWCYSCVTNKWVIRECPVCKTQIFQVSMTIEEVCRLKMEQDDGTAHNFSCRLPMR